jgi:peptidoglycan/xylan/chitin deacetylase (PgdA/CDA1 family)
LRFVSPALKHIVFPALSRCGYLSRSVGAGPAVVTYHGVLPFGYEVRNAALDGNLVRADALRRQLRLLKKRYHVIVPEEFLSWSDGKSSLPPRSILLTCDDALQNTLTEMVPVLRELDLSCLFFATGASTEEQPSMLWYEELYLMLLDARQPVALNLSEVGFKIDKLAPAGRHACWWDLVQKLSQFDRPTRRGSLNQVRDQLGLSEDWGAQLTQNAAVASRFLTLNLHGLRQLAASGMTIGAHSLSHPVLAWAPNDLAWQEISEGRSVLEKALGRRVWAFGYPFGNAATVTMRDVRLAEEAGFRCAFMNAGGGFGAKIDRFTVPRVHVTSNMSLAEFEAHLAGFYRTLRKRFLRRSELEATMGA